MRSIIRRCGYESLVLLGMILMLLDIFGVFWLAITSEYMVDVILPAHLAIPELVVMSLLIMLSCIPVICTFTYVLEVQENTTAPAPGAIAIFTLLHLLCVIAVVSCIFLPWIHNLLL